MKNIVFKILSIIILYLGIILLIISLEKTNPFIQKIFVLLLALAGAWMLKLLSNNVNKLPWLSSKSKREKRLVNILIYIVMVVATAGILLNFLVK